MASAYCFNCGTGITPGVDTCDACTGEPSAPFDPWEVADGLDLDALAETRAYRQSKFRRVS